MKLTKLITTKQLHKQYIINIRGQNKFKNVASCQKKYNLILNIKRAINSYFMVNKPLTRKLFFQIRRLLLKMFNFFVLF